ncbi:hypothetical protein E2C01_026634 [Portunus trituberculatus]|uniref:Uncharacterized protein n=1 Tax=Portunus trituberculatus TaxID=210409 RepID=A0A5B7EG31_PORTR|nr:hypothetical protein [Portunus trituberculatus]
MSEKEGRRSLPTTSSSSSCTRRCTCGCLVIKWTIVVRLLEVVSMPATNRGRPSSRSKSSSNSAISSTMTGS